MQFWLLIVFLFCEINWVIAKIISQISILNDKGHSTHSLFSSTFGENRRKPIKIYRQLFSEHFFFLCSRFHLRSHSEIRWNRWLLATVAYENKNKETSKNYIARQKVPHQFSVQETVSKITAPFKYWWGNKGRLDASSFKWLNTKP